MVVRLCLYVFGSEVMFICVLGVCIDDFFFHCQVNIQVDKS